MDDARILVLGSISGRYKAEVDVRDSLLGVEGTFSEHVDGAVYTGTLGWTPDARPRSAAAESERIEDVLGGIAADVPVVAVPGNHNPHVAADSVFDAEHYAPAGWNDDAYVEAFDELTYVPLDDTVTVAGVQFTQNPALVDDGVLLTHEFYPELSTAFADRDAGVYLSGAGLHGRRRGNCLNALFCAHDLGPGAGAALGGYYLVDVTASGITAVEFEPLGAVSGGVCTHHRDRGRQYAIGSLQCPFCRDERAYFDELLREAAYRAQQAGTAARLSDLVGRVVERHDLTEDQRETLRAFALEKSSAASVFAGRPIVSHDDRTDAIRDPTEVTNEQYLYASDELGHGREEQLAYFARHGVTRSRETTPEDLPPADTDDQAELDRIAYHELPQGEWFCFPAPDSVTDLWEDVLALVADRTLYDARVGTEWTRVARENEGYGVMVAVPNYFDRNDVERVYGELRDTASVPAETLMFKPLLYTMYGIDAGSAGEFNLPGATRFDPAEFH